MPTSDTNHKRALIVGAGLVGSLWAIFLAKRGYEVSVYERRKDLRRVGYAGGRSINLAMSERGWAAVTKAGILDKIRAVAIPMHGRMMHALDGTLASQAYGKADEAIYSVSRGGLNLELLHIASEYPNIKFYFQHRCLGLDGDGSLISFENEQTGEQTTLDSPLIFGTDGAFSAVRSSLQKQPRFNFSQSYLEHGYKELHIPADENGCHVLDKNVLHIWARKSFLMIALPNSDGSFTCTLFHPFAGAEGFDALQSDEQIRSFFQKYFADAVPLMPDLLQDFKQNPTSTLVTMRCSPWQYQHRVLLMGDAAHAIVPFYGQGMNSGFEDCTILDDLAEQHADNWEVILDEFNATRIPDADAIAELAHRNFVEMRDLVGDPMFLLRKKIAARLHEKYPDSFLPVYSMISFSNTPYSVALREDDAQNQLFDQIFSLPNIAQQWESAAVDAIFERWRAAREFAHQLS